jgi:hypothetical protein
MSHCLPAEFPWRGHHTAEMKLAWSLATRPEGPKFGIGRLGPQDLQ